MLRKQITISHEDQLHPFSRLTISDENLLRKKMKKIKISFLFLSTRIIADIIHFTQKQIDFANKAGLDTSHWRTYDNSNSATNSAPMALTTFAKNWENPEGYNSNELQIPFRFKEGDYTQDEKALIQFHFDEISKVVNFCIHFYDDSSTKESVLPLFY